MSCYVLSTKEQPNHVYYCCRSRLQRSFRSSSLSTLSVSNSYFLDGETGRVTTRCLINGDSYDADEMHVSSIIIAVDT